MTLAVGRLVAAGSGDLLGSVFAVTRSLALTSFHCVRGSAGRSAVTSRVRCRWQSGASEAVLRAWDEQIDVAVLRLSQPLPEPLDPVPLTGDAAIHDQFVALGAPSALSALHVAAVNGYVLLPDTQMPNGSPGIELFCFPAAAGMSLHGLSGGPVLTGSPQRAIGLIRWNPQRADRSDLAEGGLVYAAPARRILEIWPELSPTADTPELIKQITKRHRARDDSGVYAGVRDLLVGSLQIDENDIQVLPASHGGRSLMVAIDKKQVVISIGRDLSDAAALTVAEQKMADAAIERADYAGRHYAAILTDGATWRLYHLSSGKAQLVDTESINTRRTDGLLGWLTSILATGINVPADREMIESQLGSASPWYKLAVTELTAIYEAHRHEPTVQIKRHMWAKLLTTASGVSFADDDSLFIDHSLLVATAKVIGHAVLGFQLDAPAISPAAVMSGSLFTEAKINGVIEADFFDWITEVPGGEEFVMELARRLSRFDWRQVDHDVLKHLYESVIAEDTRHQLGEYYTPDWLAEAIISECVRNPLQERVLDPSCGSGTFVFHAIRSYMRAADAAGIAPADAVGGVVEHVIGIDVHPVAVTLARVTYLLALGSHRLRSRPEFTVPIFLGDSMRWGQEVNLFTYDYSGLSVSTRLDPESFVTGAAAPSEPGFDTQLNFPDRIVADTRRFDALITRLADMATSRRAPDPVPPLQDTFVLFEIPTEDQAVLKRTFENMCRLHDEDKDHIWSYYVRNLVRPAWLSRPANQVDVLVGNPPWLVYRYMTRRQQQSFRQMSVERGLWAGGNVATNQDLAGLFVERCIELYLRPGGCFGCVMPWAVLPRPGQRSSGPHAGFRTGSYPTGSGIVNVAFAQGWDLHRIRPSFFPVKACAVFGRRQRACDGPIPLPERAQLWEGRFETKRATWAAAQPRISVLTAERHVLHAQGSSYASRFTQGASVVPRVLFLVNLARPGPLGTVAGQHSVRSRRSATEKMPWKRLADLTGSVESDFIRSLYLGECILPFRCLPPVQAIIPWDGHRLLREGDIELARYPGLADWLRKCEAAWKKFRSSDRLTLLGQLNYRNKLTRQFPLPEHRIVYSKSGMYLAAARVSDPTAIIDHKLYWGAVSDVAEARYLTAILNSSFVTMAVRPMQAQGEHNPRDFDKHVFQLPIPRYDPGDAEHARLAALAEYAEQLTTAALLPGIRFEQQRKFIRELLDHDGVSEDVNAIVKALLTR